MSRNTKNRNVLPFPTKNSKETRKKVQCRLDIEEYVKLEKIVKQKNITISAAIRYALIDYIKKNRT